MSKNLVVLPSAPDNNSINNSSMNSGFNKTLKNEHGLVKGALLSMFSLVVLVVLGLVTICYYPFGIVVPPNMIGIRQNYFPVKLPIPLGDKKEIVLLEKGFQAEGLPPGLHWALPGFWQFPGLSTVLLVPKDFQFINFNDSEQGGDLDNYALQIPTSDGAKVQTDITLIVRAFETPREGKALDDPATHKFPLIENSDIPRFDPTIESHGGPKDLILEYQDNQAKQLTRIARVAENELKKYLGELSTIDYYNPSQRENAALKAQLDINSKVNPSGAQLWATLLRRYNYVKGIDDRIFDKILQEQVKRVEGAQAELEQVRAQKKETVALWEARVKDTDVEAQADVRLLDSQGKLYEDEKISQGDRLVEESKAKIDKERAEVLSKLAGADVYLAREIAPLLRTLNGGVVTDIDPFDIDAWANKLSGASSK